MYNKNYIDIYCERLEPGLWSEPLNLFTNIAFFLAGFFALSFAKSRGQISQDVRILVLLLFAIGLGSTMFHMLATKTAMKSDVIPILLYQITFIVFYASNIMNKTVVQTCIIFVVFIGASAAFDQIPSDILNGSASYLPSLFFLSGFSIWHKKNIHEEKQILEIAALTFVLSLTLRSLDMALCSTFPVGTHFLWHVLNGLVLYLTTRAYIQAKAQQKKL